MSDDASTTELAAEVDRLRVKLARTRSELAALRAEVSSSRAVPDGPGRFAPIYPAFEDRFRGTEAEVRERLDVYLPRVRAAVRLDRPGPRVLDVGPGRGEWLGLLADADLPAIGWSRTRPWPGGCAVVASRWSPATGRGTSRRRSPARWTS